MKSRGAIEFAKTYFKDSINSIVEVGVLAGGHAFSMKKILNPKQIYLVDSYKPILDSIETIHTQEEYDGWYNQATLAFKSSDNHKFIIESSQQAASVVPNDLDLVYLDASHDELNVIKDIACWYPKLRVGGILCGHDYGPVNGVRLAVTRMFNNVQTQEVDWWIIKTKEGY